MAGTDFWCGNGPEVRTYEAEVELIGGKRAEVTSWLVRMDGNWAALVPGHRLVTVPVRTNQGILNACQSRCMRQGAPL